jgi:hypothetical protein
VEFADHSAVGTVYSADTRVVAETDYSADSDTTVDLNYGSTDWLILRILNESHAENLYVGEYCSQHLVLSSSFFCPSPDVHYPAQ